MAEGYTPLGILEDVVYNNGKGGSFNPTRAIAEALRSKGVYKGSYNFDCNSKVSFGDAAEELWNGTCWEGFGPHRMPKPHNMLVARAEPLFTQELGDRILRRVWDRTRGESYVIKLLGHPGKNNLKSGYAEEEKSFKVRGPDGREVWKPIGMAYFGVHIVVPKKDDVNRFFDKLLEDRSRPLDWMDSLHMSYKGQTVDVYRGFGFDGESPYLLDVATPQI